MFMFILGMVAGGLIVALTPPEIEDKLRVWIISQWQKVTK
jgi:hypothetical protein